jgi:error-prone DNA polymerase
VFEPRFVHLDVRSNFSLKDGAFFPEELAVRAGELGMPAVALTDRDGLYGAARFVDQCSKVGVRPILGATLTIEGSRGRVEVGPDSAERFPRPAPPRSVHMFHSVGPLPARPVPVVVLAEDARGYANLCRLITDAHMTGERGDPSLAPAQVLAHSEGLLCLLGPRSAVGTLAVAGLHDAASDALGPWRDAFGDRLFIEVQHRMEEDSNLEIHRLLRLADETHTRAVATNPVRYLMPEDAFLADALECMREIVPVAQHHLSRTNAEGYLKPAIKMRALFAERPDLCDATVGIAERCAFDLDLRSVHFPDFPTPPGRSAASVLAERCWRGMERRGMQPTREVRDRLDLELAMIQKLGYAAFFLTVAEIVEDIRAMGIRTACRGSAAGSLVCHLTGISDVDPIRHGLIFERFINPLRDELPDIDIDVESARREDVYDMVLSRHGEDRCACVCMVETYRARAAVREVGKALGLPDMEIDVVAKAFPHIGAHHIREALDSLPELKGSNLDRGHLEKLFRVAERLNGFPRHLALHPSAIALAGHDLMERVPLERSFQGYRMLQADKDDVELLGYLKLDVLGVRLLSSMRHAVDEIARTAAEKIDLDSIPLDDPATFYLMRSSDTLGCFQIESPGQRELLQKLQPTEWEDLIVEISLFRPGPVKSDMVTPYVKRRHGYEPMTYAHPELQPVLQETFGVIVYHEQVMRTFAVMAGYDMSEADRIRRHLDADPLEVEEIREDFLRRVRERGLPDEEAERIWHALFQFASFGFCKAHAAAFAVPTYQSSWLKAHWPAHFLAGVLTHEPGMYPRRLILDDARRHGIPILPLDVNRSEPEYTVEVVGGLAGAGGRGPSSGHSAPPRRFHGSGSRGERDHPRGGSSSGGEQRSRNALPEGGADLSAPGSPVYGIRLALKDVHGISDQGVRQILEARADRPFRSVQDFMRRTHVSRPVVEALAHAGAFDGLAGGTRRDRLFEAMVTETAREGEQLAMPVNEPLAPGLREYTEAERVRAELEVVEMDASRHLISFYEPLLRSLGVTRSKDLHALRSDAWVTVAGVKVASQTPAVKSGQRIIFLTLDDATGPVDVTVFEKVQDRCAQTVFHSFLLAVRGRIRKTGVRGVSIIAEEAYDLAALQRARMQGSRQVAGSAPRKLWHASGGSAGW